MKQQIKKYLDQQFEILEHRIRSGVDAEGKKFRKIERYVIVSVDNIIEQALEKFSNNAKVYEVIDCHYSCYSNRKKYSNRSSSASYSSSSGLPSYALQDHSNPGYR